MSKNMNTSNFITTDFYLTVTLITLGEQLVEIDKNKEARSSFIFLNSSKLQKKIENYKNGKLRVEPQSLFIQSKMLKNRLYGNY